MVSNTCRPCFRAHILQCCLHRCELHLGWCLPWRWWPQAFRWLQVYTQFWCKSEGPSFWTHGIHYQTNFLPQYGLLCRLYPILSHSGQVLYLSAASSCWLSRHTALSFSYCPDMPLHFRSRISSAFGGTHMVGFTHPWPTQLLQEQGNCHSLQQLKLLLQQHHLVSSPQPPAHMPKYIACLCSAQHHSAIFCSTCCIPLNDTIQQHSLCRAETPPI